MLTKGIFDNSTGNASNITQYIIILCFSEVINLVKEFII